MNPGLVSEVMIWCNSICQGKLSLLLRTSSGPWFAYVLHLQAND
ncbi:hypothetical protein EC970259_A0015 [Escherichia coli 99.0741]|nr:hypothetical protein EC970259_A0015 [Escherichia coli 99.0741]